MPRPDGRANDELRPLALTLKYAKYAEGSCLIELGDTVVLATASVLDEVPGFLRGTQRGWVTAPRHQGTHPAGGDSRKAERPHSGDPAADRPLPARGDGPRRPGRADDHPRLRRPPG